MRSFLLAGSSSLAVSALVASASAQTYTYVPYVNSSAAVNGQFDPTGFVQGDYLGSPSGLYAGRLQSDGNFIVSYGTTPNTSLLWAAGYSNPNNGPYGISVYRGNSLTTPDSLTSYAIFNPTSQFYQLVGSNYYNAPTFIQLNDNGTLSIYPGTNGAATGNAITTIATPAAVNLNSINLTNINYDLNAATITNQQPAASDSVTDINNTPTEQMYPFSVSLEYTSTQTFDWSTSVATSFGISSSTEVDFPGIGDSAVTVSLNQTTTLSKGQSTSSGESTTFSPGGDITVPPFCQYTSTIFGIEGTTTVPYTYTGIATYDNGVTAPVSGTGLFSGVNTGSFEVQTDDSTPGGCQSASTDPPSTVGSADPPSTVPEPASLALLGTGALGLAVARRRQSGRSGPGQRSSSTAKPCISGITV